METQCIEQFFIDGREALQRSCIIEFIEWIVGTLHTAVEEVARIGSLAEVGQFRITSVHGKIGGGCGGTACEQPCAGAGETKQIENIGLHAEWNAAKRVGQFMKCNADQQVPIDVGREGGTAIVRAGVVSI